jgi:hypothetical protein
MRQDHPWCSSGHFAPSHPCKKNKKSPIVIGMSHCFFFTYVVKTNILNTYMKPNSMTGREEQCLHEKYSETLLSGKHKENNSTDR